jgi:hypothetical protein
MLSECANPGCGAQFLYFGEGKLLSVRRRVSSFSGSNVEFFWLCSECSRHIDVETTLTGEPDFVPQEFTLEIKTA